MTDKSREYRCGFRAGYIDALNGYRSRVALTSTWGSYAFGYSRGQAERTYNKMPYEKAAMIWGDTEK